jgi:hypothetical protein
MGVNLHPALQAVQALPPDMNARGRAASAIASLTVLGSVERTAYAAAKAALVSFSRSWALELATTGITVSPSPPRQSSSVPTTRSSTEACLGDPLSDVQGQLVSRSRNQTPVNLASTTGGVAEPGQRSSFGRHGRPPFGRHQPQRSLARVDRPNTSYSRKWIARRCSGQITIVIKASTASAQARDARYASEISESAIWSPQYCGEAGSPAQRRTGNPDT